ncbi:unnamed protein product [Rangifer tarandus platyrhynchus]|uniref:Uncharacterized protein n=1 Tax=Rangifer tarandus platyrhynchus TaxID=3082113 RepID=A0AC59Y8B9_RANTA
MLWDPGTSTRGRQSLLLRQRTPPRPDVLPLSLLAWPCGSSDSLASSPTGEENEKQLPGGVPGNGKQTLFSGKGGPWTAASQMELGYPPGIAAPVSSMQTIPELQFSAFESFPSYDYEK